MLTAAASLMFWLGGLWRLPRAISEPQKRPLCVAMLMFALGAVFDTGPVYLRFDRAVHVNNLSDLMAHALGLIGIYFLMTSLDGLVGSGRSLTSIWLKPCLIAAVALSIVLFVATPMPLETAEFTAVYGHRTTIIAYWYISILFPVLCLVQLARTVVAHWSSPAAALRRGLKVCGLGVLLGFAYAGLKLAELVDAGNGSSNLASTARALDRGLLGVGLFLIAAGLGLPSMAPRLRPWVERRRARRSLCRLEWLWRQFCVEAGAAPVINSGPPQFLLLRRVVELRDAQATLWSYLAADDVEKVRQQLRVPADEEPSGPQVEAAALALALRRELNGDRRGRVDNEPHAPRAILGRSGGGLDLDAEVDDLAALSMEIRKAMA